MKKIWHYISYLGNEGNKDGLENLSKIFANQLNTILLLIMFVLLVILRIVAYFEEAPLGIGSLRVFLLFIVTVVNIILAKKRKHSWVKYNLIFLPPLIFIVFPTLIGFVEEESFYYYPFVLISFSIIPQLLLVPNKERWTYRLTMSFYFLLVVSVDWLLLIYTPQKFIIIDRIKNFYVFYKLSHLGIFIFINSSVYYLRKLNKEYDHRINLKNIILDRQNEELITALENLKQAQDYLVRSEKMAALGTLTAGVAHELNNPLNFISGGLGIMNDIVSESELKGNDINRFKIKENLEVIETGLTRASKILDSLMVFSYQGNSEIKTENIHKIIDSVLLFLNTKIKDKITVKKEFLLNEMIPVYPDKIYQVFINIIDNAIYELENYFKNKIKIIKIKTEYLVQNNKKYGSVEIYNNGPSIPVKIINKIFDPFFTTKDVGKGTGLGLSISYSLMQEHNGEIEVNNTGDGVSFILKLPLNDLK